MRPYEDEPLFDEDAGPLVRPYEACDGRTTPSVQLDMVSLVHTTGTHSYRDVEDRHAEMLLLCREPIAVVEIAAHVRLPVPVVKVLVSDLIDIGAVTTLAAAPYEAVHTEDTLEAILAGLQRL